MNNWLSCVVLAYLFQCASAWGQANVRASVGSAGAATNGNSVGSSMSADGRYIVFTSAATNVVSGDANGRDDVFVRDVQTGVSELVSVNSLGIQANGNSEDGQISSDGRYVAFSSFATNLEPGDTNGTWDAFLRDRAMGTTERLSISSLGVEGNAPVFAGPVSLDGRYVVLTSFATNLVPGGTNGHIQILRRDCLSNTLDVVSVNSSGIQGDRESVNPWISDNGRYVSFVSPATNLVVGDTNNGHDVFVRDMTQGTTRRVSITSSGLQADFADQVTSQISRNGRFVAFTSNAAMLVPGDTNNFRDVFVHDIESGVTERVSVGPLAIQGNGSSWFDGISGNGRYVCFMSDSSNLVSEDTNGVWDVFVRDRLLAVTERVSLSYNGSQVTANSGSARCVSVDGRYVVFESYAANIVPNDLNSAIDVFRRDRYGGTQFVSLCSPGVNGVIGCPCSNAPSGTGRGCNNSSGTGGAELSASGGAYLSSDSMVFMSTGERPMSLSLLIQGNALIPSGTSFGQGIRCAGGTLKRLYVRQARGGIVTAPDLGVGDPQVSVRSAALGDTVQAGQSRWYFVYYRDQVVLGGCSSTSNFNATQTGQVTWSP